jgi:phospholipid/cholesterol/gamma-HCH transport system substrate-binding protein
METRANYYDVFFTSSVTGLSVGAPVNLNGVAIGRVTEIRLDPVNPDQVRVTVEVDATSPIKSDSVASLELTGITGIYYVEVTGGNREAPPITRQEGQRYPIITDLGGTIKGLNVATGHIDALIQDSRPGLKDFTQSGLNGLHALISDKRVLVAGLTRVAAELERDPTRFLFGERREG